MGRLGRRRQVESFFYYKDEDNTRLHMPASSMHSVAQVRFVLSSCPFKAGIWNDVGSDFPLPLSRANVVGSNAAVLYKG